MITRKIFTQIDSTHREFSSKQIEFINNIVKIYRKESINNTHSSSGEILRYFPNKKFRNIKGLCKLVSLEEIKKKNWSLSPAQYIEFSSKKEDSNNFLQDLNNNFKELNKLNKEAEILEKEINSNINKIIK